MQTVDHSQLKSQVSEACLKAFPEARAIILWGGGATPDFQAAVADVDVIIEFDSDFTQESELASRLKALVQSTEFCRLDPFIYLTEVKDGEPLEFIAPFGFYKANPFIPYLIQEQHSVLFGQSRLIKRLPSVSLSAALLAYLPQVLSSMRRLRMDAEVETSFEPLIGKHRASLFVVLRTLYAFNYGKLGSKKEALLDFAERFPPYRPIADQLAVSLGEKPLVELQQLSPDLLLSLAKDMLEALQEAHQRVSEHGMSK